MTAQEDIEFCKRQLALVSRTFGVSIEALPESLREQVRVAYLLCRILDTIEDAVAVSLTLRESLFDLFNECLKSPEAMAEIFETQTASLGESSNPDIQLCAQSSRVFRRYWSFSQETRDCLYGPILEMSHGMGLYVRRYAQSGQHRIQSLDDLEQYCYYVAGTVGNLLTALFLRECPCAPSIEAKIHSLKRSFGLGLQMVNILKDVGDDLQRGACFLPLDLLEGSGVSPEAILEAENRAAVMGVMELVVGRAQGHLQNAREYIRQWPTQEGKSIRMFAIVPLVLAVASLALIQKGGESVLTKDQNPKVSREFVALVVSRAGHAAEDNLELDRLLDLAVLYE